MAIRPKSVPKAMPSTIPEATLDIPQGPVGPPRQREPPGERDLPGLEAHGQEQAERMTWIAMADQIRANEGAVVMTQENVLAVFAIYGFRTPAVLCKSLCKMMTPLQSKLITRLLKWFEIKKVPCFMYILEMRRGSL